MKAGHLPYCRGLADCLCERNRYIILLFLALATAAAQFFFSRISGSMAVASDAWHTFMHSLGFLVLIRTENVVLKLGFNGSSFRKDEIRSKFGLINSIIILAGIVFLSYEAWMRAFNPKIIIESVMIVGALIGFIGNFFSWVILRKSKETHKTHKLGILHILLDMGESIAVLAAVPFIYFFKFYIIDSLVSFLIVGMICIALFPMIYHFYTSTKL